MQPLEPGRRARHDRSRDARAADRGTGVGGGAVPLGRQTDAEVADAALPDAARSGATAVT
jgi:hypothetical protein